MAKEICINELLSSTLPPDGNPIVVKSNFNIHINGDMATVIYDQETTLPESELISNTKEIKTLERIKGEWKIRNATIIAYKPGH
jgi:hypothetical protein